MPIRIHGAAEHNLKHIDVDFPDGLTVVTGVSGSGKTSLVFDTLYQEARRRFLEIYALGSSDLRLSPARVDRITGLSPASAVGQNLLNRNPNSTLATASGVHPFLRLLFSNFAERRCTNCGTRLSILSEDEILGHLEDLAASQPVRVFVPLLKDVLGTHLTLLIALREHFDLANIHIDGHPWQGDPLLPDQPHSLSIELAAFKPPVPIDRLRGVLQTARSLGSHAITIQNPISSQTLTSAQVCTTCGHWFNDLEPRHFHVPCPHCQGQGCQRCEGTGITPDAASARLLGLRFTDLLALSVDEALSLFTLASLPAYSERLVMEITRRLASLQRVGLGYISLNRPSPTLSRGESQRVRLAVALTSRLEDLLHVLDEPTIGQHPADVIKLMSAIKDLPGPVVYVEHDRIAAAQADHAIDLGPGPGARGGQVTFTGTPAALWSSETSTGRYFSLRERVSIPDPRPEPEEFLHIRSAYLRNLQGIDVSIPLARLTIITGVSGSGKSTFVEDVLHASLTKKEPLGCRQIEGRLLRSVLVDQSPIGRNPRSNPATYTKLADVIRDTYAQQTGLSTSHFSFNRPEGACPTCKGMGAVEIKMRYLPSTWIPCHDCDGQRFSEEVLSAQIPLNGGELSIADFYQLSVQAALPILADDEHISQKNRQTARRILSAMRDIGLGYLMLGQPSPSLSGGEAQRVKLARFLGRRTLSKNLLILDEPTTGLHPQDVSRLLVILDRLVRVGASIVVVEHNTDVIRAADWIIDLGPGAGPLGGQLIFAGPPKDLYSVESSPTAQSLAEESDLQPVDKSASLEAHKSDRIVIKDAHAHNLKGIDVQIPKGALTVVTGLSGSGKSSLVIDILEAEARRRFLETLSLYERQSTKEGPEAAVGAISGLGVTQAVTAEKRRYNLRASVGTATEIAHHLTVLFATIGERHCLECGAKMQRGADWHCLDCGATAPVAPARQFSPANYRAACLTCHGVGSLQKPRPEKLIINPEKPLCAGAMYSPGFFPKGYLCEPYNGGYDMVQAIAARHGFDPANTPWDEMTASAQEAFLYGDPEPLEVTFINRSGKTTKRVLTFPGFYGFIRDWDVGGTYTQTESCPQCLGTRLRPEFLAATLAGYNVHQLSEMPFLQLAKVMDDLGKNSAPKQIPTYVNNSLETVCNRLRFLNQTGLGYLHLNRIAGTLSAGEAQRVQLAGLLGSGLTSLTILLDEPTRGLHPAEVSSLLSALIALRQVGNTIIVIEHDLLIIQNSDHIIDLGPGAGEWGGEIVAQGSPKELAKSHSFTGRWLRSETTYRLLTARREPKGWLEIVGARAHNLKGETCRLPLGTLVGICGVSGSGKSTLMIDTLGRALAPRKQTTSVAYEPLEPGEHDTIKGAPRQTILVDQARQGIRNPLAFLGLERLIRKIYADSSDAHALGLTEKDLGRRCATCNGRGFHRIEMSFLPDVRSPCETCQGSGLAPEAWLVKLAGISLPALYAHTVDQVYKIFNQHPLIERILNITREVGLGYLILKQPAYSLSGGEAQRLKIAKQLCRKTKPESLYILDEPTVGQHLEDVNRLINVLHRLVEAGNTVAVIEHHPHILAACDWLVELGPGGGPDGGNVIASGTPEDLAAGNSPIAPYLREIIIIEDHLS
jgi:excinuclease ABC subunit A